MIIREANIADAKYISERMRIADQQEFYKVTGSFNFFDQIMHGIDSDQSKTYTLVLDGKASAIIGTIEKQDFQVVWACATDKVNSYKLSFIKALKTLMKKHEKDRKPFVNYVDVKNENAIKFLKASGFILLDKEPYGKLKEYFYPFYK
jgi:hypothetical protein